MKKIKLILTILLATLLLTGGAFAQSGKVRRETPKTETPKSEAPKTEAPQAEKQNEQEKVYSMKEVDQKPKVIKKPHPSTEGKCDGYGGRVLVRVVFHRSGQVRDIEFREVSPCRVFNENALRAAEAIRFEPAIKDGQTVSVSAIVEYAYNIY